MKCLLNIFFTKVTTKKVRGHGLLELIVAVTIITIVFSGLIASFAAVNKFFYKDTKEMREKVDLEEALYFIENQIYVQSKSIKPMDDRVILYMKDSSTVKAIKLIGNNLYMLNGDEESLPYDSGYKNYIVKDIKEFRIKVVGKILYLDLESINGVKTKGCYLIRG